MHQSRADPCRPLNFSLGRVSTGLVMSTRIVPNSTYPGSHRAVVRDGRLVETLFFEKNRDPSPIGQSLIGILVDSCRITRPVMHRGWPAQAPLAHSALVNVEHLDGEPPPVPAFQPPDILGFAG